MLTEQERAFQERTGMIPKGRLEALIFALHTRRDETRERARNDEDAGLDERWTASLRGKAAAYQEAAHLVEQILSGHGMKKPKWSRAVQKSNAFKERRAERIVRKHLTPEQQAWLETLERAAAAGS